MLPNLPGSPIATLSFRRAIAYKSRILSSATRRDFSFLGSTSRLGVLDRVDHNKTSSRSRLETLIQVRAMSSLTPVSVPSAPAAVGPYSQAIKLSSLLFVSGCIPLDPSTGDIVPGGIEVQTEQALKNLKAVVEGSGSKIDKIAKTTVFIKDMNDFATINGIYAKFFGDHKPARSCVEVARLPKDVLFEIECIASLE